MSLWLGRPATKAEVQALTLASVAPLYRRRFWDAIQGDQQVAVRSGRPCQSLTNGYGSCRMPAWATRILWVAEETTAAAVRP
ncbi:hypothetical protein mvi_65700 (plasmid) [Methylobacterium indicum]|uniref:Uncharacterized protein n=1 Tax=Methylobacterium indicum TaxID=1775910 RepID=A0A8H8X115_9HYPH|nr:hypothetical protein mvi_65700 [Methylobacterium indicum]